MILGGVPRESRHAGGIVGVPISELTRFSNFWSSLYRLQVPHRTGISIAEGSSVAKNCNEMVRVLLKDARADWLWILGDDHVFLPEILMKLLDRDVDIVVPLCYQRKPPFMPVIYRGVTENNESITIHPKTLPKEGLIEVGAAGTAGMLIRRRVFEKMADPWFEFGRIRTEDLSEDIYFCRKALLAGAKIYCDVEQVLGHTAAYTVWPFLEGETWGARLELTPDFNLTLFD